MSIRRRGMARLARRKAERRLAVLGCIRLFSFAVKRVFPQKRIVFLFLEPVRRLRTLLVPLGHVTRDRFSERFRFGAFEGDNFLGHFRYSFDSGAGVASDSSASPSLSSSSVKPKRDVTDWRVRDILFCFSSCDWHSTVKRANGIASKRACGSGLFDISHTP